MSDFIICYEHVVREVENISLLKYELGKRGYSCEIIPYDGPGFFHFSRAGKKAKVVVTPWLRYNDNVYHYLQLAQKPYKLVNLQWEQVYYQDALDSGLCSIVDEAMKGSHICWGENQRVRLRESGVADKLLPVTGAIQMDFGRPLFQDYYLSREQLAKEAGLDPTKKWLLMVSSFSFVNYGDDNIAELAAEFDKSVWEMANLHVSSHAIMLKWIEELLKVLDCEFIYRPHPSENVGAQLQALMDKYPNFHVIMTHSVKQWAKVCDKVNLWASTANAEIAAMGVDYLVVRPEPVPAHLEMESLRNEDFITDCETFIEKNRADTTAEDLAAKMQGLSWFYSYDPETPAYIKVADYLEKVLLAEQGADYAFTLKQRLSFTYREFKKKVFSYLMEKQLAHPESHTIQRSPVKEIVRSNAVRQMEKYQLGKEQENATLQYLRDHQA